jgi:hypothetical protein
MPKVRSEEELNVLPATAARWPFCATGTSGCRPWNKPGRGAMDHDYLNSNPILTVTTVILIIFFSTLRLPSIVVFPVVIISESRDVVVANVWCPYPNRS